MSKKPFSAAIIYVILGLVFIALIGARTISTPEIWTHLAQGKTNAPISYIETDSSVNTTHMYDKIVYAVWNMGGASALIIFNVILLLGTFILLLQVSRKWGGEVSQGFALLISGHLIFLGMDVGPKTIMMLFIALFVYLLSTIRRPAVLFGALIPLQILWTNMHDSFLFGPLLVILAAIQADRTSKGPNRKKQQELQPGTLGILTAAVFAATLINPYFAKLHAQVIANIKMPDPFYWGSLFSEYFHAPTHNPLIFLVLILGAGGLITLKKQLPIMLTSLAIIGAFLIVSSANIVQLFAVLAFPFMVLSFTAVGEYLTQSFKTLLGKQAGLLRPATQVVFVLLVILSLIPIVSNCAYTRMGSASTFGLGIQTELYPSGAEAIIGDPAFPEKALNLAADGGYLAFNYGRKVFIDYRPGRYDRELLGNLNAMMFGNPKAYDAIYVAYRPEAIILNTLSPFSERGLYSLLSRQIWKLAYFDGVTAILLLDKEEFAPLLNNTEAQAAGLARLEAARAAYALKLTQSKASCAGNPAELIGSGKIFLALNRPVESKAIFSLLLKGNNTIPGAWIGLGNSQLMLKEFDAAADSLNAATRLAPDNLFAWVSYAKACERAGRTAESQKAQEKVKSLAENMAKDAGEDNAAEEAAQSDNAEAKSTALQDITIPE